MLPKASSMRIAPLLVVLISIVGSAPAIAERWRIQPNVRLDANYSDNVRFVRENTESGFSALLDATLRATRSTEASDTGIYLGLGGTNYPSFSDLNNQRGYAGLDLGYRLERQSLRFGARFDSISTIYSETATTGLVQLNNQQNTWRVSPGWSYNLTERSTLNLDASYIDVSYDEPRNISRDFTDYRLGTVGLKGTYRVSERLSVSTRLDYGRYEAREINNQYDNFAVLLGADYAISERSSLRGEFGVRRTDQTREIGDGVELSESSSGQTYQLSYFRRFEAGGGLDLKARRELAPSGSGQVLDTVGLYSKLSLPLNARWQLGLDAAAYRNQRPDGRQGLEDRTYASIAPLFTYVIDETWRLSAGYRFRWEEREQVPGDIVSNAVFLTLNWTRPWDL